MTHLRLGLVLLAAVLLVPSPSVPPAAVHLAPVEAALAAPAGTVSSGAEPMILVAPDGTLLVGDTHGVHRSRDGGGTWTTLPHPFLPGAFNDGRAMALDAHGRLYVAHTQGQVIGVAVSEDLGDSWSYVSSVVGAAAIADRPWLAARGDGRVVLVFYGLPGAEQCAFSTDAGRTWLVRTTTNGAPPNAGNVVLDPEDRVWYAAGDRVYRWNRPCQGGVVSTGLGASGPQIFDQVALTAAGEAFVARPTPDSARMELTGLAALDGARRTLAVSPDTLRSNTFGAVAARADGSEVVVAWYGSATAGNPSGSFSGSWDVYVARVTGFWTDAPDVRVTKVTTEANHVGGFCMAGIACTRGDRDLLDYFGVAYDAAGAVHVAYGHDGATRAADVRYARLD